MERSPGPGVRRTSSETQSPCYLLVSVTVRSRSTGPGLQTRNSQTRDSPKNTSEKGRSCFQIDSLSLFLHTAAEASSRLSKEREELTQW